MQLRCIRARHFPLRLLIAAKRIYPWPAGRTPITAEHERGPHPIFGRGNAVELEHFAAIPAIEVAGVG
jgi:hypothetical protein